MTNYSRAKVTLQEYLEYTGRDWGKPNSGGYSLLEGHDSFFINFEKNNFTWFARDEKGGIYKMMEVLDGITDDNEKKEKLREIRNNRTEEYKPDIPVQTVDRATFDYDKLNTSRLSEKTENYLTEVRGINPVLVNALAESGFLVEEKVPFKNHEITNLLYNWKDSQGHVVGADQQGVVTRNSTDDKHSGYHKGIVKGSPASEFGFNFRVGASHKETPDKLVVVEAPVDAISYWQMNIKEMKENNEQVAFVSLSGVKASVLNRYVQDHYFDGKNFNLPKEIHFATDNDQAGREFTQKYGQMLDTFEAFDQTKMFVDVPGDLRYKDWNDQLRFSDDFSNRSVPFSEIDTLPFYEPELSMDKDEVVIASSDGMEDIAISEPEAPTVAEPEVAPMNESIPGQAEQIMWEQVPEPEVEMNI